MNTIYDQKYFDNYVKYAKTDPGITKARCDLIEKFLPAPAEYVMIDIGIGCGAFVEATGCYGWDINPVGVEWLNKRGLLRDPKEGAHVLTFWDCLEHIPEPADVLDQCSELSLVFVSAPIYENREDVLKSKHYKPNEHVWYHTMDGMKTFMKYYGFDFMYFDRREETLGRHSIGSFVFQRQ